jgi:hypothetical protein
MLSIFGVFGSRSWPSVHQVTGTVPIAFPRLTIQTNPSQTAILASTSLEDTTGMIVYSKDLGLGFAMLCGLKFLYRGCSQALLGEDSCKSQTIRFTYPIHSIRVHYAQCFDSQFLIVGLTFTTGNEEVSVGNCDSENPDILQINQVCFPSPLTSPL